MRSLSSWSRRLVGGLVLLPAAVASCGTFGADTSVSDGGTDDSATLQPSDAAVDAPRTDSEAGATCLANRMNDPRNCGSCNHDCLDGICTDGVCQPFALLKNAPAVASMTVLGGSVYWVSGTAENAVHVATSSGPSQPVLPLPAMALGETTKQITRFGTELAVSTSNRILDVALTGASQTVGDFSPVTSLSSLGSAIFFTGTGGGLARVWVDDSAALPPSARDLASDNDVQDVAATLAHVYWYSGDASNAFYVCDRPACTSPRQLFRATGAANDVRLAANTTTLFFIEPSAGTVNSVPVGASAPMNIYTVTASPSLTTITSFAVDERRIYFATDSAIQHCATTGCVDHVTVTTDANPHALFVSQDSVYWATSGSSTGPTTIWQLVK